MQRRDMLQVDGLTCRERKVPQRAEGAACADAAVTRSSKRYYYLDFIRASLMLLGIPYHAALIYLPEYHWNVASPDKNWIMYPIAGFIHSFRMEAFFILSGFFAAMLLSRRERWTWLKSRYARLGIPLLTSAVLLIPFQVSLIRFFDEGAASHPWVGQYRLFHFWFLPALLLLCSLLAISWDFVSSGKIRAVYRRLAHPAAPWILAIALTAWACAIAWYVKLLAVNLPFVSATKIFNDPLIYLPYFTIGVIINLEDDVFDRFVRIDAKYISVGVLSSVVFIFTFFRISHVSKVVSLISGPTAALFLSISLFAIGRRYLDFSNRWASLMADSSLTIYLLHQPMIIVLGFLLLTIQAPTMIEFVAICLITYFTCLIAHLLLRRSDWLKLLFNGIIPREAVLPKTVTQSVDRLLHILPSRH